jgi:SLA1 homology domain 1, SHD1
MQRLSLTSAGFFGLFVFLAGDLSGQEFRTWKDKSGRALEAEMVGVDAAAGAVKMRRKDGTEVSVPIALLSPEDVTYAKAKWQEMQAAPAGTPPVPAAAPAVPAGGVPAAAAPVGAPAPARPALTVTPVAKFKMPGVTEYLRTVPRVRPRLIHAKAGWDFLTNLAKTDPTATALLGRIQESGTKLLEAPELTRIFGEQGDRVTPGSQAIFRIAQLGTLHFLQQDPRWLDRGVKELVAICDASSFADWYPAQPHVTTDFLIAACLGYDWLQTGMNKQQIDRARECILNQGVAPLMAFLEKIEADKVMAEQPPGVEEFGAASALLIAALCLADEDAATAKKAAGAGAKIFGKGMLRFAPAGVWPDGPDDGDKVLDYAIMVIQSIKSCSGGDLGFSLLEGFARAGDARLFLTNPAGQIFNYGDTSGASLSAPWVGSWLAGMHGNPGLPAVVAGPAQGTESAYFGLAGTLMYHNPHAAGYGTASGLDAAFAGAEVATLRTAWNDKNAMFVGIKGGNTSELLSQLDLGTFILDAGGVRWGIELGAESDRGPGMNKPTDRAKRYGNYREGSGGQNVITSGGANQPLDAKAAISGFISTPERGVAIVDLKGAYSGEAKDYQRGAMLVRGAQNYAVIQDDFSVKGKQSLAWSMHTRATVAVDGRKAVLTQGKQTLNAVILSPEGATFSSEEAPEQVTPLASLKGVNVLKVKLSEAQGEQRITVAFALGAEVPPAPVLPLSEWIPKK